MMIARIDAGQKTCTGECGSVAVVQKGIRDHAARFTSGSACPVLASNSWLTGPEAPPQPVSLTDM